MDEPEHDPRRWAKLGKWSGGLGGAIALGVKWGSLVRSPDKPSFL
jgi:hypothetical protein